MLPSLSPHAPYAHSHTRLHHKKLNQLEATAICGNDISSSCLYVSALAIGFAGQYAWIALLIVAGCCSCFAKFTAKWWAPCPSTAAPTTCC